MTKLDKREKKLKKDIKWYTYVDKNLDHKLKTFIKKFDIKSQASLIRNSVDFYIDCVKYIHKIENQAKNYNKQQIFSIIEESLENNRSYSGLYEEIRQQLSPLKLASLLANRYSDSPESLSKYLDQVERSIEKLEKVIKARFERPSPLRFKKEIDILHIEDNVLNREMIKDYFKRKGFIVQSVRTSEKALEILKHVTPRLILLDLGLKTSKIQGDEFCCRLKSQEDYADIPIIIMSALFTKIQKSKILSKTDADDFIVKPITELSDLDKVTEYI